jgi:chromate transporter
VVDASAIFLPSFIMMLAILPLLQKMKDLQWLRAFMRGAGPAVIGALAVSLMQMAPHAAPDVFKRRSRVRPLRFPRRRGSVAR